MKGALARKVGMTSYPCPETGRMIPVTLLEVVESTVLQVKTLDRDGYSAAVLGAFPRKRYGDNENQKYKFIKEFVVQEGDLEKGAVVGLEALNDVTEVQISGRAKGKGFAGVIKRYNFSRGPETHGSHHHREPGSAGMCAKPGRILKGKKMPGRMGNQKVTLRSVSVMKIDTENSLVALKGAVPGAKNSYITLVVR